MELKTIVSISFRSASICQDGGQVLGILRITLVIVQEPPEHELTTAVTPLLYFGARVRLLVETQAEALCLFA